MYTPENQSLIHEVERYTWDALQEQARKILEHGRQTHGWGFVFRKKEGSNISLLNLVKEKYIAHNQQHLSENDINQIRTNPIKPPGLADAVHDVYFSAMHLGLIVPNDPANRGLDIEYYNFTHRGLDFFESGEISMSSPGLLPERIQEIIDSFSLDPGIVPLVEEAYNCWSMGLLRASMVLIGVAVENICNSLLEALSKYPCPPQQGTAGYNDWKVVIDETKATYSRWKSAYEILKSIKAELRKSYKKPDWWHIWEPVPEAIHPYYETVRIARNEAAHSLEDVFTHAQVGLLLASMPSMIEVMVLLTDFLGNNHYKVTFLQL